MNNSIAILGIHTGIGKTIASAVISEAVDADYWKPVQAGIEEKDSDVLRRLLTNGSVRVHDEAMVLSQPMSPHAAAIIDGVEIDYRKFKWPDTGKTLLVETAGGVLSPMSTSTTMADFVQHFQLPAILVVQNYLGSINHTLLSIEVLKSRGIKLLGMVMNGTSNESSETFISVYGHTPIIARIPNFATLDNAAIVNCARELQMKMKKYIQSE